jgi:hypothetical protein
MLNVAAIILSVFATMWALNVALNVVSIFHIFMAGIIAVEFSSHINHVFCTQEGLRRQRFQSTFKYLGGSLPHVALMLLISIIAFFTPTRTYIFHVWGFVWGGIAFFTFTHCFFVLPILLTLIGPRTTEIVEGESNVKMMDAHEPGIKVGSEVEFVKADTPDVEQAD